MSMIGTPVPTPQQILRAFPRFPGAAEQFYDVTALPWNDRHEFREELEQQGFYVQDVMLADPMPIQVGIEIRKRIAAEQEKA